MIALATSNPSPRIGCEREQGYDTGYRVGLFDGCNDRPQKTFDGVEQTEYNWAYINGYLDGWCNRG